MRKASAVLVWVAAGLTSGGAASAAGGGGADGGGHSDDASAAADEEAEARLVAQLAEVLPETPPARPARLRRGAERLAEQLRHKIAATSPDGAPGIPAADERCALGVLAAHAGDLPRAQLLLAACLAPDVGGELRERGGQSRAKLARALRKSELSPVDLDTNPSGWLATVEGFPEAMVMMPYTPWLPPGKHVLRFAPSAAALRAGGAAVITRELELARHSRGSLFVEAPVAPRQAVGTGTVTFEDEAALEAPHAGPPPPEKHRSMLPERYRKGLGVAMPEEPAPAARAAALVLQAGGGWQAPTDARRAGPTTRLAAQGRVAFAPRLFVELGVDWTHRFGDGDGDGDGMDDAPRAAGDAFGALLGARAVLWRPAELSLLAALRGRLESGADARGGGLVQLEARPVARWPLAVGGAVELERGRRSYSAFAAVELWAN
jgi:hypothetical protein